MGFRSRLASKMQEVKFEAFLGTVWRRLLDFDSTDLPLHEDEHCREANLTVMTHIAESEGLRIKTKPDGGQAAYGPYRATQRFDARVLEYFQERRYFDVIRLSIDDTNEMDVARMKGVLAGEPRVASSWEEKDTVLLRGRRREIDALVCKIYITFGLTVEFLEYDA